MKEHTGEKRRPVIGCLPLYPPEELIHSFGAVPEVLWGAKDAARRTPQADMHIQNYVCSVVRNIAEHLFTDTTARYDGLLFYNACDPIRNLPEILADGWHDRNIAALDIFRIHVPVDSLDRKYGADYLKGEIGALTEGLARAFGREFSAEQFREAAALYGRMRDLSMRLDRMVADGRLSFDRFSRVVLGNYLLVVEERITRADALIREGEAAPLTGGSGAKKRVVLSGILPPPPAIIGMIEEAGMIVAGNDIAALARTYSLSPEPTGDPADYYLRFYRDHFPCTTLVGTADRRMEAISTLVREREAAGLIVIGEKFCEYEYFEIPHLVRKMDEIGVRTLALESSAEDEGMDAVKTRIEAFGEMI